MTLPLLKVKDDNNNSLLIYITEQGAEIDGVFINIDQLYKIGTSLNNMKEIPEMSEAKTNCPNLILTKEVKNHFKITTVGTSSYVIVINGEPTKFDYLSQRIKEYFFSIEFASDLSHIILDFVFNMKQQKKIPAKTSN